jgi:RNase P/RNase MRP subunit p29
MIDLFGERVSIAASSDPTLIGVRGTVMLESMKMLYVSTPKGIVSFPKRGSVVRVIGSNELLACDSMVGRLEDRLLRRTRA